MQPLRLPQFLISTLFPPGPRDPVSAFFFQVRKDFGEKVQGPATPKMGTPMQRTGAGADFKSGRIAVSSSVKAIHSHSATAECDMA